jgi:hypothetical protein
MLRAPPALAALLLWALPAFGQANPPASVRVLDWMVAVPVGWTVRVPSSEMRVAQFSAASPSGTADIAVFFFGAAGGGSLEDNIQRWAAQFSGDDGKPVQPRVDKGKASGMPATRVALDGRYRRGVGSGSETIQVPNQSLRVAVLETARGNLIFQLWGDRAAVAVQEARFGAVVQSLRPAP